MLISIIIPFFNAENNSLRLLNTLSEIKTKDIEFILINDGSSDNTYSLLENFKSSLPNSNITLIDQNNRGPGGARNSGLNVAKGKYIWFVDCDDDIKLEAINVVRKNKDKNYDFIDFDILRNQKCTNTMGIGITVGQYTNPTQMPVLLLESFGSIWSKMISRKFLLDNSIFYPEYCLYEDNPLRFIYPFFVKSFLKTDIVGYVYYLDFESVTRSTSNLKTFDRLYTATYGFTRASKLIKNKVELDMLEAKFIEKYLIETIAKLGTKMPSKEWVSVWRVMKQYRNTAKKLNIKSNPFYNVKLRYRYKYKYKLYFLFHWILSHLIIKDQTEYFDTIRRKAWS